MLFGTKSFQARVKKQKIKKSKSIPKTKPLKGKGYFGQGQVD